MRSMHIRISVILFSIFSDKWINRHHQRPIPTNWQIPSHRKTTPHSNSTSSNNDTRTHPDKILSLDILISNTLIDHPNGFNHSNVLSIFTEIHTYTYLYIFNTLFSFWFLQQVILKIWLNFLFLNIRTVFVCRCVQISSLLAPPLSSPLLFFSGWEQKPNDRKYFPLLRLSFLLERSEKEKISLWSDEFLRWWICSRLSLAFSLFRIEIILILIELFCSLVFIFFSEHQWLLFDFSLCLWLLSVDFCRHTSLSLSSLSWWFFSIHTFILLLLLLSVDFENILVCVCAFVRLFVLRADSVDETCYFFYFF